MNNNDLILKPTGLTRKEYFLAETLVSIHHRDIDLKDNEVAWYIDDTEYLKDKWITLSNCLINEISKGHDDDYYEN